MRELVLMAKGRVEYSDRLAWNHTASLMGLLHNINAKKRVGFDFYNPYVKKKSDPNKTRLDKSTITSLKQFASKGRGLKRRHEAKGSSQ